MHIHIEADKFLVDGRLTYSDFPNTKPEALGRLMNSRMVQAAFEDENPETAGRFAYADGSPLDPDRQTNEFIAMLPEYRRYGVIAHTLNFQGGIPIYHPAKGPQSLGPQGPHQPWDNSGFTPRGALKWKYAQRMQRVIEAADDAGVALIVGLFYFGQNHKLLDEAAVKRAVAESAEFLTGLNRGNIMIEVANECDIHYVHPILQPARIGELIQLVRDVSRGQLLVSTSFRGGTVPPDHILEAGDFVLPHGNQQNPDDIRRMTAAIRGKTNKPVVFNEDSTRIDNMRAAWESGASWGYYDHWAYDGYPGFQQVPTSWAIDTPEKKAFFETVAELVGIKP